MSRRVDPKRIERLEAFARSMKVEDAKRRHLESLSKMSDEEVASEWFAHKQIKEVVEEDPCKADELFRSGVYATERFEERARLGWRRFCETGGQAAVVDFCEAIDGEGASVTAPSEQVDFGVLFEGPKPPSSRVAGVRFHLERLATEPEKKAHSKLFTRPKSR